MMEYKEVIYSPLIDALDEVIQSNEQNKNDHNKDSIDNQNGVLESCRDFLYDAYSEDSGPCLSNEEFLDNWQDSALNSIDSIEWTKLKLFVKFANVIEKEADLDLNSEVGLNFEDFLIGEYLGSNLPFSAFAYFSENEQDKIIAFVNFSDDEVEELIASGNVGYSNSLVALFLSYILTEEFDVSKRYIVYHRDSLSIKSAESALKLHAAIEGKVLHVEQTHSSEVMPQYLRDRISAKDHYSQFEESFIILSEFNKQSDIISKFMSLYHIIESFMFKVPIVNLGAENNGGFFSIRDFRRLYDRTSDSEVKSIESLFNKQDMGCFWERDVDGIKFGQIVSEKIGSLSGFSNRFVADESSQFISKLNIKGLNDHSGLCNDFNAVKYSRLIYKVRCAIVHNKETELHISHFNLTNSVALFIEKVLIVPLQILIYDLLTDPTSKVWYEGPEMKLYQV